ncbi:hypothetical protein ACHAXH_005420 [Discostella pseudostelligera]|jgi:hypothetical protein
MSFRDFTPRQSHQQGAPLRKGPLRRTTSNTLTGSSTTSISHPHHHQHQRLDGIPLSRSRSDLISYDNYYYHGSSTNDDDGTDGHGGGSGGGRQSLLIQQREEEYALRTMQQREKELLDIHHKMHVVDAIYKDLGEIVGQQQEQIDTLENQFERAEDSTRRGLEQLEKANKKYDRRKQKKGNGGGDDAGNEDDAGPDKKDPFFLFAYLSKKASEITRLISVCGGSGSVDYVHGECCNPR